MAAKGKLVSAFIGLRIISVIIKYSTPKRVPSICSLLAQCLLGGCWLRAVVGYIKLALQAGKANPAPPVGPALGAKVRARAPCTSAHDCQGQREHAG